MSLLLLCLFSCKKESNTTTPEPVKKTYPGFLYSGNQTVLSDIRFDTLKIPPGSSLTWNFGDGTSSLEFQPRHKYFKRGVYQVTLEVLADTLYRVVKDINITIDPARFAVSRHWTGTDVTGPLEAQDPPIVRYFSDTLASVTIHSDSTLSFWNTPLMYHKFSPDTSVLSFKAFAPKVELIYDVKNDQLSFYYYETWGAGQASGFREIKLKTK